MHTSIFANTSLLRMQRVASFLLLTTSFRWKSILAFRPIQRLWQRPLFSVERTLPPLASIQERAPRPRGMLSNATMGMGSLNTWTLPYSSRSFSNATATDQNEENLQVLYTNDPKQINNWLNQHLSMDGCTIGFDTEVGAFSVACRHVSRGCKGICAGQSKASLVMFVWFGWVGAMTTKVNQTRNDR